MTAPTETLEAWCARGALQALDLHFARGLGRLGDEHDPRVLLAVALVSRQVQQGHVCLELPRLCAGALPITDEEGVAVDVGLSDERDLIAALRKSSLVGGEHGDTPLCLDDAGRLYLRRHFEHERSLAAALLERARRPALGVHEALLGQGLARLFGAAQASGKAPPATASAPARARGGRRPSSPAQIPLFDPEPARAAHAPSDADATDFQRVAAESAVRRALCVISGGPGTGKTATVVKILALLVEQALAEASSDRLRVLLLAPTGKAAARLSESVRRAKAGLHCEARVRDAISEEASTIHRALGTRPRGEAGFRHHRGAPLAADVVVVDEASMVDLALMSQLFDALPAHARVVLLGDEHQLASVEAGAVLGDICGAGLPEDEAARAPIARCIVRLRRSYRYAADSGIGKLATAVNAGDATQAIDVLRDASLAELQWVETAPESPVPEALVRAALRGLAPFFAAEGAEAKLQALERYRVLCAHRRGTHGQTAINAALEARLRSEGVITTRSDRYAGRALIVTENDYPTRLFNGDVGVLAQDADEPERLLAWFVGSDGKPRSLSPARLPPHESVYAMSVHKSQGSEVDEVAVLLPSRPSPVLSRELLYTAVTRARKRVLVYAPTSVLTTTVQTAVERASGLRAALYGR